MRTRRLLALAVLTAALAGLGATGALAGEVKGPPGTPNVAGSGSGKPTAAPDNANSICVFSGLHDDPGAPLDGSGPNGPGGTSQSYGQEDRLA